MLGVKKGLLLAILTF